MKINIIRVLLIILLLGTVLSIYGFSNQNGENSRGLSKTITEIVTKNIKSVQNLEGYEKEKVLIQIEYVIRKIAHFCIYTVVGILLMALMSIYKIKESKKIIISFTIGVLYAITDEIHQSFVPERTAKIADIIIDSMGVLIGILCVWLVIKFVKKVTYKKLKQNLAEQ